VSARAAARHTETYEISVLDARTTGMRGVGGNLAIGVSFYLALGPHPQRLPRLAFGAARRLEALCCLEIILLRA